MVKEGIVDVSESMGAMLFGVLMTIIAISTLTIAGTETEVAASGTLIAATVIAINLGHGIIHGYMIIFERGFERGKYLKHALDIKASDNQHDAITRLEEDINNSPFGELSSKLKKEIALQMHEKLKRLNQPSPLRTKREDYFAGFYNGSLVFFVSLLVVLPLLIVPNLQYGAIMAGAIGTLCLGILGWYHAKYMFRNKLLTAIGVAIAGLTIVVITVALGG